MASTRQAHIMETYLQLKIIYVNYNEATGALCFNSSL